MASSLIPVKAGDRVKTDRAGELTALWVPDAAREALRVLGKARQHLQGFLLRYGRHLPGQEGLDGSIPALLTTVRFEHLAQQIVFQDYVVHTE